MEGYTKSEEGGNIQKRPCLEEKRPLQLMVTSYSTHAVLGHGGFGTVMLATCSNKSQPVAMKVIHKAENRQSIAKEVRILKMASGCPFLCHAHAAFQTKLAACIVMEYASGNSLEKFIKRTGKLKMDAITFYTAEIICGLQFLHANGIVHRDIKLDNILLTGEGHIKIADFGVAVEGVFGQKKVGGKAGTVQYMAPEVLQRRGYDAGADWWSLGIVICKMATGMTPFTSSVIHDEPLFPKCLGAEIKDLLHKLLEKDPEKRLGFIGNIRAHPVFNSINWEQLERQEVPPPLYPAELTLDKKYFKQPRMLMEEAGSDSSYEKSMELSYLNDSWKS
ncbi:protein kinase C theta type-like isoform X2 [Xenopus laevis]|uniref:Protein kinase C theta type-like isoform X2 n=1 Tax=Xenopus laevis TaxID=8355 RepID=A0A8J1M7P1_XENLA|nr:protein kinase C theta type-like isoform X2 [Xenopus laevis]